MEYKRRTSMRGVLAIWVAGIVLGLGAGAVAASMLRYVAPEPAPTVSLAANLR